MPPPLASILFMLDKIDRLRIPASTGREVECILVRQVSRELDRGLPWQEGHGRRTAATSLLIGEALGLAPAQLHDLTLAALLHDIGLLMLPSHLAERTDSLNHECYLAIQNHSRLGATLLEPFLFLKEAAILIAHHHERWDGSGYPYGIRGAFVPLGARILAIADAYDAIKVPDSSSSIRNLVALRILQVSSGTQFDPALVQVLFRIMNALPEHDRTNFPLTTNTLLTQ
ncbi:MAG: HD domain-containing phosphohydrolase [Nitrospirota bacterium]|nr:HD domain-containing phosphohydrolase [Nitrospirota bacterium]MDP2382946.1 HD domain-containing phosphohydrolase [Nitrospirota bacterium]